jgi:Uma2 family endonuclease
MSSVAQRLLTAQEFWHLSSSKYSELVRGEVIETMPPGGRHGEVVIALGALLHLWVKGGSGGYVGTEAGFIVGHDPDTVRGPDISYVSAAHIPPGGVPEAFWPFAPDLAVEVVFPSETANEVQEKVRDFLSAGTPLVWVIYPRRGEVVVYTADGLARTYSGDDALEQPQVLPGFSCRVSELFA